MAQVTLTFYNAVLVHAGNKEHEIPLNDISERELKYLRAVHGAENISGERLKKLGERAVDDTEHFYQLARKYGSHEDRTKQEEVVKRIEKLFGVELGEFDSWLDATVQAEDEAKSQAGRQRQAEAAAYSAKREAEIRAEAEAKVKADLAAKLGMTVEELSILSGPAARQEAVAA